MELKKEQSGIFEFLLKCPICYEMFDSTVLKPKLLPCGHTLCLRCVGHIKNSCKDSPDQSYISYNSGFSDDSDKTQKSKKKHRNNYSYSNEDNEEEEEESDDEEEEENDDVDENFSYADNIHNEDEDVAIDNVGGKKKVDTNEQRIKLKCSICRNKYKLFLNKLIDNKQILNYLELNNLKHQLSDDNQGDSLDDNLNVFCTICKKTDILKKHKLAFPHHDSHHIKILKDIKLFKSNIKSIQDLDNLRMSKKGDSVKTYLNLNFDVLINARNILTTTTKQYLTTYTQIYDNLPFSWL